MAFAKIMVFLLFALLITVFLLAFVVCTSVVVVGGGGVGVFVGICCLHFCRWWCWWRDGGAGGEMRTSKDHNIGSFTQGLC